MKIVRTIDEFRRSQFPNIGFVPTLGAFHEGHLSLMRTAKENHDTAVVSIFVNPTQFAAGEDFERYPRDFDRDAGLAEAAGIDAIFAPSVEEMYPRRSTQIVVSEVTDRWEGESRPGHFTGVATVVAKLFSIVQPQAAYFGLKDLQQCMVIRRMTEDLNLPVALKFEETVRDSDGLALSSRNVYLSAAHREIAPSLYFELRTIADAVLSGDADVEALILESKNRLRALGFAVDYLDVVDLDTMVPVRQLVHDSAVIVAAKLGTTRLIDNIRILSK